MFDMYASEVHYAEHLVPVWFALSEEERGEFYGPRAVAELLATEGIHPQSSTPPWHKRPVVIAGAKDLARCGSRPVAMMEHGVGQTYLGLDNPSFPGGSGREKVALFLCPSERVAHLNLERYPDKPHAVVGSPKLDRWAFSQRLSEPEVPTIAVSFHWNCKLLPETKWALPAFDENLVRLTEDPRFRVIGHGHPRAWSYLREFYAAHGVEAVEDFDQVVARASVYVVDNSSTLYEATFADIPTVVMNAPWYRKDVHHGLRFWDTLPAFQCEPDMELVDVIERALQTKDEARPLREAVTRYVYAVPDITTTAAQAAAKALRAHLAGMESSVQPRRPTGPYKPQQRLLPPVLPERRFRRLGANAPVLNEARLRWVEMSPAERAEEQARIAALTDSELSSALAEMMSEELVTSG